MRSGILLLFFCSVIGAIYAQQFGANPPSVKWQQLDMKEARIIFPRGLDSTAKKVAETILDAGEYGDTSVVPAGLRKVNIVLQNQTTRANGYVGLAPWRSEFYMTPAFNSFELGSLPWAKNLTKHEYRHVQQYQHFRKGISKIAYYILGEEGQAVANNASVPNWFFEGDAVYQETYGSEQGRGRLPYFFNGYRALWNEKKDYRFMKLRNGSWKHYIPDHYILGYMLSSYGREKYGKDFWYPVTEEAAQFKGVFYPFQRAVKKYTGVGYSEFVNNALDFFKADSVSVGKSRFITSGNNRYVINYSFPQFLNDDSLIVLKKTFRNNPAWYLVTEKGEEIVREKDISRDEDFSTGGGKIVYTAYEPDPLWGGRDYSVIKLLNIKTKQVVQLTRKSKYFQPGISSDGEKITAIQYTPDQVQQLHILDAGTGAVLSRVPVDSEYVITYPRFYDEHHIVACTRNAEGLMAVTLIQTETGAIEILTPWSFDVKGFPLVKNDTIYFTSGNGRHDDIYAVEVKTKNLYKLTDEPTGAYQPAVDNRGRVVWSSFTARGLQLKDKHLQLQDWQLKEPDAGTADQNLYLSSASDTQPHFSSKGFSSTQYSVSKYSKWSSPFNFHSWRPFYDPPEWSLTLYGQNILNTFQSELSYTYNENEGSHNVGYDGLLGSWFPWITGGVNYTLDRKVKDSAKTIHWNELNAHIGLRAPFDFTKGKQYRSLTLASSFYNTATQITGRYKDSIANNRLNYLQMSANWSSQVQKAVQHINPRFAQALYVRYRTMVDDRKARQFLATGSLYFPGIAINHSLVLNGAFQLRDTANQYRFGNSFPFARGYAAYDMPRMWKGAVNYHFPIVYPDWGFGQLVYFLRIRANLFFDYAQTMSLLNGNVYQYRSAGSELYFDTKWWNQQSVSFGIRYSRLLDTEIAGQKSYNRWELILPVDLFSH